jgi:hypothetical protein
VKKYLPFSNRQLWRDSAVVAFAILGGIDLFMSISAFSIDFINGWWLRLLVIVGAYVILFVLTLIAKVNRTKNEITLEIRSMKVIVRGGDIFATNGWKLIPFNEYFDTQVDDVIISHTSLNGKYIDALDDDDREALRLAIIADEKSPLPHYCSPDVSKTRYELGTIKTFKDVMMLALAHFNKQNEAHTNRAEYENTLRTMWREISRVYAGKPINIPLIGGGITRLDDMSEKPNEQLLKCILCTLRTSTVTFIEPITIILTKSALETVNLYELKGVQ